MADEFKLALARNTVGLDAGEIASNRLRWHPVSRENALQLQRSTLVAVVSRSAGFETASWFDASSPYFLTSQASDYANLRYFAMAGGGSFAGGGGGAGKGTSTKKEGKPKEEEEKPIEREEFEPDDFGAEPEEANPFLKPEKPSKPVVTQVTGEVLGGLSALPKKPEKPGLPDIPKIPDKPALPDKPKIPELPEIPDKPEIPELPLSAEKKHPIEVAVVDSQGQPVADVGFVLTLPDGKAIRGRTDIEGKVRLPDNDQEGEFTFDLELEPKTVSENGTAQNPAQGKTQFGTGAALVTGGGTGPQSAPVEIQVMGPKGKPLPDTEFEIDLPDGARRTVKTDSKGFIRVPENAVAGDVKLTLTDFQG